MGRLQQSEVVHLVEEAGWEKGQTIIACGDNHLTD